MAAPARRSKPITPSSSSSSSDDPACGRVLVPVRASEWKRENLENIGIFYDAKPTPLSILMDLLKKRVERRSLTDMPEVALKLIEFTKKIWTFSFDVNSKDDADVIYQVRRDLKTLISELRSNIKELQMQHKDFLVDPKNSSCFQLWSTNMAYFFGTLSRFIIRMRTVGNTGLRRANFTHLFSQFSKICLLDPENGDTQVGSMKIKGVTVNGIPDLRFLTFPSNGEFHLTFVTEVKQLTDAEFQESPFDINCISSGVLGQHGVELLIQRNHSFFSPAIAGLLCIGTKVIFTYLDMKSEHFEKIKGKKEIDSSNTRSSILYSQPFDFMDVVGRNQIIDAFFWFGFVQSHGYDAFPL